MTKDLQQRIAMQQLEIHNLRQVLYYWREEYTGFEPSISVFQLKVDDALATPATYDDLMAWHEAQLDKLEQAYCYDGNEYCSELEDIASEMQEGETVTLYTWKHTKPKLVEYKKDADGCLYAKKE